MLTINKDRKNLGQLQIATHHSFNLPRDIIHVILDFICTTLPDLYRLQLINSYWRRECRQSRLWLTLEDSILPPLSYFYGLYNSSTSNIQSFGMKGLSHPKMSSKLKKLIYLKHNVEPYHLRTELAAEIELLQTNSHKSTQSVILSPESVAKEYIKRYCHICNEFNWFCIWLPYIRELDCWLHDHFDLVVTLVTSFSLVCFMIMTTLFLWIQWSTISSQEISFYIYHVMGFLFEGNLICHMIFLCHQILHLYCNIGRIPYSGLKYTWYELDFSALVIWVILLGSILLFSSQVHFSFTCGTLEHLTQSPLSVIAPCWILTIIGAIILAGTPERQPSSEYLTLSVKKFFHRTYQYQQSSYRLVKEYIVVSIVYSVITSILYTQFYVILSHISDIVVATTVYVIYSHLIMLLLTGVGVLRVWRTWESMQSYFYYRSSRLQRVLYSFIGCICGIALLVSIAYVYLTIVDTDSVELLTLSGILIISIGQLTLLTFYIEGKYVLH